VNLVFASDIVGEMEKEKSKSSRHVYATFHVIDELRGFAPVVCFGPSMLLMRECDNVKHSVSKLA
jgi:hypothetical protein